LPDLNLLDYDLPVQSFPAHFASRIAFSWHDHTFGVFGGTRSSFIGFQPEQRSILSKARVPPRLEEL
jgi:hypothetical protein